MITTIELDPATGLPKVPEGQYWLVEDEPEQVLYSHEQGYGGVRTVHGGATGNLMVRLVHDVAVTEYIDTDIIHWYGTRYKRTVKTFNEAWSVENTTDVNVGALPTKKDIYEAAVKILMQRDAVEARLIKVAESHALKGAYPPKILDSLSTVE